MKGWFIQVELFGGRNSAINAVQADETAFFRRNSLFNIQFYASSPRGVPPYPQSGFTFLDGQILPCLVSGSSSFAVQIL